MLVAPLYSLCPALPCHTSSPPRPYSLLWCVGMLLVVHQVNEWQQRQVITCAAAGRGAMGGGEQSERAGRAGWLACLTGCTGSSVLATPWRGKQACSNPPEPKERETTCPSPQRTSAAVTPPSSCPQAAAAASQRCCTATAAASTCGCQPSARLPRPASAAERSVGGSAQPQGSSSGSAAM